MLSLIIPAYNEEENILRTAERVHRVLTEAGIDYEVLFVDDGSRDATWEKIREANEKNTRVRGVRFSRNFGKESAIFAGLSAARGDACVVLDCDLQHPAETIPEMERLWREEGYEVVEGIKRARSRESLVNRVSAGLFYRLISRCAGFDMRASSDFKLLDRKVVDALCAMTEKETFFRALSFWVGFRTARVEYDVAEREFGTTKWSLRQLTRYAVMNVTSFSAAPLYFVTFMGAALLLFALVLGLQTLIRWISGSAVEGFTTVILLMLLIGGCVMLALGIIGYYLARIYTEVKGRPRYIVSQTCGECKKP